MRKDEREALKILCYAVAVLVEKERRVLAKKLYEHHRKLGKKPNWGPR